MARKRGSRKISVKKPKQQSKNEDVVKEVKPKRKINYYIAITLICLFILVLFTSAYFNYTSGIAHNPNGETLGTRFFLAGPDPYYNMRLCEETLETGHYPFVELSDGDPLLNYPVGVYAGARPPLFNMIAVGSAKVLGNFMTEIDALGWSMLFLPCIYGALIVFPIYGIGKELFNKKVGLIGAFLLTIIPIHINAGHGSAFSLFDHDSFLLLLFTLTFYFLIKALKSEKRNKMILYSFLTGISMGCVELTWAASQTLFIIIILYLIVQTFFDIIKSKTNKNINIPIIIMIAMGVAYFITLPYTLAVSKLITYLFYMFVISIVVFLIYFIINKLKIPWIISLPGFAVLSVISLVFLYLVNSAIIYVGGPIQDISSIIFGSGIYGTKVSLTIGEAHTYGISQTVMSFGPVLYWLGMIGFIFYLYMSYKDDLPSKNIFIITLFSIQLWMTTNAGRFINDMIPIIVIFAGFSLYVFLQKIDYISLLKNMKNISGFRKIKVVKPLHMVGVLFVVGLLLYPNAFMTLDASVPGPLKQDVFGSGHSGAYGLGLGQQYYWSDACYWLSQQDTEFETDAERPGVLTWWDYGFYLVSMSKHPAVADNYQEGIPPASNFHTAQSEKEATAVMIIRLIEGVKEPMRQVKGTIPDDVKKLFRKYVPQNHTELTNIIEDPEEYAPSYDTLIAEDWGNDFFRVGYFNAMYHDATKILIQLSDEDLTKFYHDLCLLTNTRIGYYGVEYRDMYEIFSVFTFLSDKSTYGQSTREDDWYNTLWTDTKTGKSYSQSQVENLTQRQIDEMDLSSTTVRKEPFFNSMAYKTYFGIREGTEDTLPTNNRLPCYLLKHWKPTYVSPQVVIAKYYEGANITGTVDINGVGYDGCVVYLMDEYGIPHDYSYVQNGQFKVIAPQGNVSFIVTKGNERIHEQYFGYITEEEATWKVETNKTVSINIEHTNLTVNVETNETVSMNISSWSYPDFKVTKENITTGEYDIDYLISDYYNFDFYNSTGYKIYTDSKFLKPGYNYINISVGEI